MADVFGLRHARELAGACRPGPRRRPTAIADAARVPSLGSGEPSASTTKRSAIGRAEQLVSTSEMSPLSRFSTQSRANGDVTSRTSSDSVIFTARMGLSHISNMGLEYRGSSAASAASQSSADMLALSATDCSTIAPPRPSPAVRRPETHAAAAGRALRWSGNPRVLRVFLHVARALIHTRPFVAEPP